MSSIFEIANLHLLPNNKSHLVELLKAKVVIPFHKKVCARCHAIPNAGGWQEAEIKPGMDIFHVGKGREQLIPLGESMDSAIESGGVFCVQTFGAFLGPFGGFLRPFLSLT